jgi:hypothetical protein
VRGSHYSGAGAGGGSIASRGNCLSALKIALIRQKYDVAGRGGAVCQSRDAVSLCNKAPRNAPYSSVERRCRSGSRWNSRHGIWAAPGATGALRALFADTLQTTTVRPRSIARKACLLRFVPRRRRRPSGMARAARAHAKCAAPHGHVLQPAPRLLLRAERRMFESPRLRAVICNSRMVRDEILRHLHDRAGKTGSHL